VRFIWEITAAFFNEIKAAEGHRLLHHILVG